MPERRMKGRPPVIPYANRDSSFGTKPPPYERVTLDGAYRAWFTRRRESAIGLAHSSYTLSPSHNPSQNGTLHHEEAEAQAAVDYYMDTHVPQQQQSRAGRIIPTERVGYVNGELAMINEGTQYRGFFVRRAEPAEESGSVGTPIAVNNGLGKYTLYRPVRQEDGSIRRESPTPEVSELLSLLLHADISRNQWSADDDRQWYPVAADIANAAFPGTQPPYAPGHLPQPEAATLARKRSEGDEQYQEDLQPVTFRFPQARTPGKDELYYYEIGLEGVDVTWNDFLPRIEALGTRRIGFTVREEPLEPQVQAEMEKLFLRSQPTDYDGLLRRRHLLNEQLNEEERLHLQTMHHLEDRARQRDVPTDSL